jgi:cupin fold WbuC family metalloprotein
MLDPRHYRREINPDTKNITYWALPSSDMVMLTRTDLDIFEHEMKMLHCNGRICLHHDTSAPFHDMIIFEWGTHYFPIHRHPAKSETVTPLTNPMRIYLFHKTDRASKSTYVVPVGHIFVIGPNTWHQLETADPYSIYRETKVGPFLGEKDREFMTRKERA